MNNCLTVAQAAPKTNVRPGRPSWIQHLTPLTTALPRGPTESERRATGIRAVGDVPWGTHFFLFYETKEDLLDALVPYFKVGLESGEFCVWGAYKPLTGEQVKRAMRHSVPGFDRYLNNHSIEIIPGREFYLKGEEFDLKRVIRSWDEKLHYALANGYAGLRLSSNTAWLQKKQWSAFNDYEEEVNDFIAKRRALALCTYPLARSTATEILDVARTHQFAIARRKKDWEIVETAQLKQAKAEIKKLNNKLEQRVIERTQQLTISERGTPGGNRGAATGASRVAAVAGRSWRMWDVSRQWVNW